MTTTTRKYRLRSTLAAAALAFATFTAMPALSLAQEETGLDSYAATSKSTAFDTPEAAIAAFTSLLAQDDFDGFAALLGLDAAKLRANEATLDTYAQIREGAAKQVVVEDHGDEKTLDIGAKLWPLPFPIVRGDDGKWSFDTLAGINEILNRRVGENELEAIATMRAYVDAENDYAMIDHDDDGVFEYAQKLISTPGTQDGLYWPTEPGEAASPAGDIDQSELEDARKGDGYFGYHFRILTGQGENVAGGAYDYVINGNMIGGFALLAWPAKYAETGVNTFVVNQRGVVYEIDLGDATPDIVKYIDRFNPDDDWNIVKD